MTFLPFSCNAVTVAVEVSHKSTSKISTPPGVNSVWLAPAVVLGTGEATTLFKSNTPLSTIWNGDATLGCHNALTGADGLGPLPPPLFPHVSWGPLGLGWNPKGPPLAPPPAPFDPPGGFGCVLGKPKPKKPGSFGKPIARLLV
jgi:hypothetical protein